MVLFSFHELGVNRLIGYFCTDSGIYAVKLLLEQARVYAGIPLLGDMVLSITTFTTSPAFSFSASTALMGKK